MSTFKIILGNEEYLVTERNRRTGLFELISYNNGSAHIIGKSCKTDGWIYISKSPFCLPLCLEEISMLLDKHLTCKQEHVLV